MASASFKLNSFFTSTYCFRPFYIPINQRHLFQFFVYSIGKKYKNCNKDNSKKQNEIEKIKILN